jgi:hypothetical protein
MTLGLGGNFISSLHGCKFSDEMATVIDLRDNLISTFEDLNVAALPKWLAKINLEGNPIVNGLSSDELEELHRKILYRIIKEHNRAKRPSHVTVSPPPPSAPPLEYDNLLDRPLEFGGPFFGGSKQKTRKPERKLKRKNQKTNKRRISKNKHKK